MKQLIAIALALLVSWASAAPATPSDTCLRIAADIERAEQARKAAIEKGDTAWKTVLPFAVIARKASSKAAVDDADRQLAALRHQARTGGCDAR